MKAKAMAWLLTWFMIAQSTLISYHTEAFVKTEVACTVGSLENCFFGLEYLRLDIFSIEVNLIDSSRKMHSQYCSICQLFWGLLNEPENTLTLCLPSFCPKHTGPRPSLGDKKVMINNFWPRAWAQGPRNYLVVMAEEAVSHIC